MIFKDLSASTLCDLITSGHVDGLYWVVLLEKMGSIGKPLGTVSLSAILNLRSPTHSYFDYIYISKKKLPATDSMGAPLSLQVIRDWNKILK